MSWKASVPHRFLISCEAKTMELTEVEMMYMKMQPPFYGEIPPPNSFNFTCFDQPQDLVFPLASSSLVELIAPSDPTYSCPLGEFQPFLDAFASTQYPPPFCDFQPLAVTQEEYAAATPGNAQMVFVESSERQFDDGGYRVGIASDMSSISGVGFRGEKSIRSKRSDGQPSKNLMAERRRRKRLNDRLSMLRSIVPKISKMDRTSILGDTIDYLKELRDKIHKLREEDGVHENSKQITLISQRPQEQVPNDVLGKSPPKFDVNKQSNDTRIEVCCTAKPGLLLSTLTTLDSLGLDVEQCVISCFNDFSFQASCIEVGGNGSPASCEDIKQALFINAGYGGRCL